MTGREVYKSVLREYFGRTDPEIETRIKLCEIRTGIPASMMDREFTPQEELELRAVAKAMIALCRLSPDMATALVKDLETKSRRARGKRN